jgi:hypothetical protein
VLKGKPEDYFKKEARRLGMSVRSYCRKYGIVYSTLIGKEVNYGEPTVPLSSLDERELERKIKR